MRKGVRSKSRLSWTCGRRAVAERGNVSLAALRSSGGMGLHCAVFATFPDRAGVRFQIGWQIFSDHWGLVNDPGPRHLN